MLTLEQLQKLKEQVTHCAYCNNQLEHVWVDDSWLEGKTYLGGYFRCTEHKYVEGNYKRDDCYYLNEKEMFTLKIL